MKLPIKKKYFDLIKSGEKKTEYRDSHITFICEETGETIQKNVWDVHIVHKSNVPSEYKDVIGDEFVLRFLLS